jgi:hypothetical protein
MKCELQRARSSKRVLLITLHCHQYVLLAHCTPTAARVHLCINISMSRQRRLDGSRCC